MNNRIRGTNEIKREIGQMAAQAAQLEAAYRQALELVSDGAQPAEAVSLRVQLDAAHQRITTLEAEHFEATAREIVDGYRTARQQTHDTRETWKDARAALAAFEEEYKRRREELIGTAQRAEWQHTDAKHAADHFVKTALEAAPFDVQDVQRLKAIVEPQTHQIALEADQQKREADQRRDAPIVAAKEAAAARQREAVEAKRAALMPQIEARRAQRAAERGQQYSKRT